MPIPPFSSAPTPDATSSRKGKLQLTGDLGGTATSPVVKARTVTLTVGLAASNPDRVMSNASDYATINTAISDVNAAGGGKVVIRAGNYTPTDHIRFLSNVDVEFERGAKITLAASKSVVALAAGNMTITGLYIDAAAHGTTDKAVQVGDSAGVGANDITFQNPRIVNCGGFGIYHSASGTVTTQRVFVNNPYITGNCGNDLVGGGPLNSTGAVVSDIIVTGGFISQTATGGGTYTNAIDVVAATRLRFNGTTVQGGCIFGSEQWPHSESMMSSLTVEGQGTLTAATAIITSDNTNVADAETVTIGSTVYRFKNTMAAAYDVQIGVDADTSMNNLIKAINVSGVAGTNYFTGTAVHPSVGAGTLTSHAFTITALQASSGIAGNAIATTETSAHLSWGGTLMTGGVGYVAQVGFIIDPSGSTESHYINLSNLIVRKGYVRLTSNPSSQCKNVVVYGVNVDATGCNNGVTAKNIDGLRMTGIVANAVSDGVTLSAVSNARFDMHVRDCGGVGFNFDSSCSTYDISNSNVTNCFAVGNFNGFNPSAFNVGGMNPQKKFSIGNSGSSKTINRSDGHYQTITISATTTLTIANAKLAGEVLIFEITNTSNTITWSGVTFRGGTPPVVNGTYTLALVWDTTWLEAYRTLNAGIAASGANSDITSLSGLTTPLSVAQGGTGAATLTGLIKGNGTSAMTAAVSSTDYAPATSGSGILKGNGAGGFSTATADTDYTTPTGTETLTNKRISKRVGTTTSSATPTVNTDNVEYYELTAQAVDITSFTTNLSGTPTNAQTLWISITGTASRAITWGTSFEASTVALPTTTSSTSRLDVGFIWNAATSKWRCVAVA